MNTNTNTEADQAQQKDGWRLIQTGGTATLVKTFAFDGFRQTMRFVNAVAKIAHSQNHHPDMLVQHSRCTIRYTTHDAGNTVTTKDFAAVEAIEALELPIPPKPSKLRS